MNNFCYTVSFFVVSHFICSATNGLDLHSQRDTVLHKFGGGWTQMEISNLAAIGESNELRPRVIDTPKIFSVKNYKVKPISTRSRQSSKKVFDFMQNEILDQPRKGIFRYLSAPWRA